MNITLVKTFYDQGDNRQSNLLHEYINLWDNLSYEIKKSWNFVIIDDCSKIKAEDIVRKIKPNINIDIYRVQSDVFFNVSGARNIGAKECKTTWMYQSDMDWFAPQEMYEEILSYNYTNKNTMYKFLGKNTKVKPSWNISKIWQPINEFIISKSFFWELGGYNESFTGHWGYDDRDFLRKAELKNYNYKVVSDYFLQWKSAGKIKTTRDNTRNKALANELNNSLEYKNNDPNFQKITEVFKTSYKHVFNLEVS